MISSVPWEIGALGDCLELSLQLIYSLDPPGPAFRAFSYE